ncbi:hypothetical protein [Pinirhizobacter soli]|uniref:hypothetical protein n=1 Tax=Pinirhizobacter soli TaxID=2786953 RepID=UPI00202A9E79|nr:hypothetical protein [Pinirhizobacter soli]
MAITSRRNEIRIVGDFMREHPGTGTPYNHGIGPMRQRLPANPLPDVGVGVCLAGLPGATLILRGEIVPVTKNYRYVWTVHRMMAAFVAIFLVFNAYELLFGQTHRPTEQWVQILLVLAAICAGHIYLAIGSSHATDSSRVLSLVAGIFYLFLFPVGTVVGGFLIYNCHKPWEANARASQVATDPTDSKTL